VAALALACAVLSWGGSPPISAAAQPVAGGPVIRLGAYEFDPLVAMASLPQGLRSEAGRRAGIAYYIVQFADRVTLDMRRELDETEAVALHYVHENAFIVRADAVAIDRASRLPSVRWIGPYEPAYALSPTLALEYDEVLNREQETAESMPGPRIDTSGRLAVLILTMESSRVEDVAGAAEGQGATGVVRSELGSGLVRAEVPRAALENLARQDGVLWIERELPAEPLNDVARWTIQSFDSETLAAPVHQHGVTGAGQTITVTDTGLDRDHAAFPGSKVTAYYTPPGASGDLQDNGALQHGTHVSGSAAGDDGVLDQYDGDGVNSGISSQERLQPHDGQAFGARIQMQDISSDPTGGSLIPSSDLSTHYNAAISRGSWINTNSWGSRGSLGQYIPPAATTDDFIWSHPEFTVLFAAGNSGPFLRSINPFATAKNLIAVGSSGNGAAAGSPSSFSSRGPTLDGRLKPDLMAPGSGLWSARGCDVNSGCGPGDFDTYQALSGTSMATPTAAGAAALVRQYYMGGWYPTGDPASGTPMTNPSAALIKATLINSAVEMTSPAAYANGEERYPNNNQGWGRILLDNALHFPGDPRDLVVADDPGVTSGQTRSYQFVVGNPFVPFKATLVWSDRPRTAPTTPDLINNLDLVVTAPDGAIYRGNAFERFNPGESRRNPPVSAADNLNNVENVLVISNLRPGIWTVSVTGANVPFGDAQGRQPFALVMTGQQVRDFGVVALDRSEYLSSETVNVVVLDANLNQDPNTVETARVDMTSDTETLPVTLTLFETAADSGVFGGSIPLQNSQTPIQGDPYLQVKNRDRITAVYLDADDGAGGSGTRQDTATIDEDPPVITGVAAVNLQPRRATITWTTDEPADSTVSYGNSLPLTGTVSDNLFGTGHLIELRGLVPGATYLYQVRSADEHGTARIDDNGGAFYTFTTPSPGVQPSPEWATYQNSPARHGASGSFILPPLTPQWSVANNTNFVDKSSPVVSGGIVYTAEDGWVRARYASSGVIQWEQQLGDRFQHSSTPAVSGNVVYAVVRKTIEDPFYGTLVKGFLYALRIADGTTIWTYTSSAQGIDASFLLAVDGGVVVTKDTADISAVLGVNAATGLEAWRYTLPGVTPFRGASAGDGKFFFPQVGPGGTGYVTALDQATGATAWTTLGLSQFPGHVPLFAQGLLYLGGEFSPNGAPISMLAIDAANGSIRWAVSDFDHLNSAPAYDGTTIYLASADSQGVVGFVALDSTSGDPVWSNAVSTGVSYAHSSLTYANGHVYTVTEDAVIRTFDAATGALVDSISVGEQTNSAHLAIAGDSIFVEGNFGTLFAFRAQEDPDDDNDGDPDVFDCAPSDPSRHHGAIELCNGVDDNCVDGVDEGLGFDADQDGWSTCQGDCRDDDPRINGYEVPEVNSSCFDQLDNDCDGVVDWDCALDVVPPETVVRGTAPSGGLSSMAAGSTPDDVYYTIGEDSSTGLEAYYRFVLPPPTAGSGSVWWALRVEGYRSGNDAITFQVARLRQDQTCGPGPLGQQHAFYLTKSSDDDRLQVYQIGPPNFDTVAFCVILTDQNQVNDRTLDTVRLDKMYIMPIILDAKASSETTQEGSRVSGDYTNTQSVGGGQEVLREGTPTNRLRHTWSFDSVPVGFSHHLYFEATRPNNSEKDNFQFYYALPLADGSPGAFSSINGAVVSTPTAPGAVTSSNFGPAGVAGRVYIQIRDTKANGAILDSVSIDYLAIRTTP
jgi:hypothetical protein